MSKNTLPRLLSLRAEMAAHNIDAFIIPGTDPHQSEYYADYWDCRTWISGFDGSAGTAVVTAQEAGLWTDSRYFLQAAEQLSESGFVLFKDGLPDTPSYIEWLSNVLPANATVAIDGTLFSTTTVEDMTTTFGKRGISLITDFTPFNHIWQRRPCLPQTPFYVHDEKYSGECAGSKIERVMQAVENSGCNALLLSALDEIAWLFNIRGNDVKCNPVIYAYAYIDNSRRILFVDSEKLNDENSAYLQAMNIEQMPYNGVFDFVASLRDKVISIDPGKLNYTLYNNIATETKRGASPIVAFKAIKNETQIAGIRKAMVRDGVALIRLLRWLDCHIDSGQATELSVTEQLRNFRAEQELFVDESFDTIAGYNEHGAIVHYSATPESNLTIRRKGFFLLDSGAQYLDGTTDITRTIPLGSLTHQQKRDYTLVLKGHIALARCQFPEGTRGAQLDAVARLPLWGDGLTYLHGTGHGVGHFLNVHEGPQSIRLQENPTPLMPGMITSNEPGLYRAGEYGIRHENLVLTVPACETEFGRFLRFETLTLFPFDKKALDMTILLPHEIAWLNDYHRMVYDKLKASLTSEECEWLREATSAI